MPVQSEWMKDREIAASEAYQHGRTQQKLASARQTLERIAAMAKGKPRMSGMLYLAELGLMLSGDHEEPKHDV